MPVRTNTEHKSELPAFTVKPSNDFPGWSNVTCPRESCGLTFFVETKPWREGRATRREVRGRSCPYCFRAALMPGRRRK